MAPRTDIIALPFTPDHVIAAIDAQHRAVRDLLEDAGTAASVVREVRGIQARVRDLAILAAVAGRATA